MNKSYKCPFENCNYETTSLTSLKRHVKRKHFIERLSVCPVCKRECRSNDGLRIHCAFNFDDVNHALLFYFLKSSRKISLGWRRVRHKVYRALQRGKLKIDAVAVLNEPSHGSGDA